MSECRFSKKLNELRNAAGLTQAELANVLSVSDKVISKWENGLSSPDIDMLVRIADYFGVSTDVMLGKEKDSAGGTAERVMDEFKEMDKVQAILAAFDISRALVPAMFDSMAKTGGNEELSMPSVNRALARNCISNEDFYNLSVCTEDVNMAVMLFRNRNDFQWLNDRGKNQKIAELFAFLSDVDALSICYYVHSKQCSWDFTVEYIAEHTGVSVEKTKQILDTSVGLELCARRKAHLLSGETDIYSTLGDGDVLALITLAYERQNDWCSKAYNYCRNEGCKMIRGNANGGGGNESV